jgi:PAS domain-containing protein
MFNIGSWILGAAAIIGGALLGLLVLYGEARAQLAIMAKASLSASHARSAKLRARAAAILRALPSPLALMDWAGRVVALNPPAVPLFPATGPHALVIRPATEVADALFTPGVTSVRVRREDGTQFPADLSASKLIGREQDRAQVFLLTDTSDKRDRRRALQSAQRDLSRAHLAHTSMVLLLCHELRNPSYVLAESGEPSSESGNGMSLRIRSAVDTATQLLGQSLESISECAADWSKQEASKDHWHLAIPVNCKLSQLIQYAIYLCKHWSATILFEPWGRGCALHLYGGTSVDIDTALGRGTPTSSPSWLWMYADALRRTARELHATMEWSEISPNVLHILIRVHNIPQSGSMFMVAGHS